MQWLMSKAPGFQELTDKDISAIVDFLLLWTLFEARILNNSGSAAKICAAVADWHGSGMLQAEDYKDELAYFRDRYFSDNTFTYNFDHLNLRAKDKAPLVRAVINGSDDNPRTCTAAIFIIIFRYRNNLFHGIKWQHGLAGERNNFINANAALMKALDQFGQLEQA